MDSHSHAAPPADPLNAFCVENHIAVKGADNGPLSGRTVAVKDVFHIAGARTGFGQPQWLADHPPAEETAPAVRRVLDAGADVAGKTKCDEFCYSLAGENAHYEAPVNPRAPGRVCGGSSSGSASVVAGGLVDFALGTDCGGSVRLPAGYCGILGMRPTHGRIPLDGLVPFAGSFDCVGWFARDADLFMDVGRVLLEDRTPPRPFRRLLIATDTFDRIDPSTAAALRPAVDRLAALFPQTGEVRLGGGDFDRRTEVFRILQGAEIWSSLGAWITANKPKLGPGVDERIAAASAITRDEVAAAKAERSEIIGQLEAAIGEGDVVCLPSAPGPAPLRGSAFAPGATEYRKQAMALLCNAGLGGLPQISLPLAELDGLPLGLSILARRDTDIDLLELARTAMT
jgi:amidase